jgi:thiol-disulfide isomerase/thioredoxin
MLEVADAPVLRSIPMTTAPPPPRLSGLIIGLVVGLLWLPRLASVFLPSPQAADGALASGKPVEIAGPTLDGGRFDLAEQRGKVVVVDFWATWCKPCIAELPTLQAIYQQYHDRGVQVVSISLDYKRSDLTKFLEASPLPWPQIYFERNEPNHPAARFNVEHIPYVLVIDREGKLVDSDVRGKELHDAILQALGETVSLTWKDHLTEFGSAVVQAPFYSILKAPGWLLVACGTVGACLGVLVQQLLRRAFRLRTPAARLAPTPPPPRSVPS